MPPHLVRRIFVPCFVLAITILVLAPAAHAQQLWASSGGGTPNAVTLSPINPSTGANSAAFTISGGAGLGASDLAGDPLWQGVALWGVRFAFNTSYLAAWNPITKSFISESPINTPAIVNTLAIDPTNGRF